MLLMILLRLQGAVTGLCRMIVSGLELFVLMMDMMSTYTEHVQHTLVYNVIYYTS